MSKKNSNFSKRKKQGARTGQVGGGDYKFRTRHKVQSERQRRVGQLINSAVMSFLRRGGMVDERLVGCPLTITKVTISPDLKIANIFFLPFNTVMKPEEILDALDESNWIIRKAVAAEVKLKFSPELRFFFDKGFEEDVLLDQILD